jgi:cytoskeletal protein CcmA (bactofilin family)
LFADGELPEGEAREVARHLQGCEGCDGLVNALRAESRMLVQCLQDVDLEESSEAPEFASSAQRSVSVGGFALGVIGVALAFRVTTGLLFGFRLPAELEWFNPREWILNLSTAVSAAFYAARNAELVSGAIQTTVLLSLGVTVLIGMVRMLRRSTAASSVFAVLAVIGLSSSPSYAIDARKGAAASISATETIDDTLIATADDKTQKLEIAGTIKGDLLAFGDAVTISGTVEGNVIVFARRVEISGNVGGSVVGAAQTLNVTGRVARNLVAAGTNVNLGKSAEIGGNAITAGSETVIEGKTARDLITGAGVMDLRGEVGRNVKFAGGQVSLSGTSRVGGDLDARVGKEENVSIATGAVIGGNKNIALNQRAPRQSRFLTVRFYVWQIVRILAAFVTGLILFKLIPALVPTRIVSGMDWLKAGGIGFITLVTVPVAFIVLAVTVIGLPIAILSLALWGAGLYFAKIVVAEFIGRSMMQTRSAMSLLAGLVVVVVAVNLPWIGTLISFLLLLLGLGAIAMTVLRGVRRQTAEI